MEDIQRIEVFISGKVQMVMFRDFTKRKAETLGITGEVMNMTDGCVKVIAEGERSALEKLLKKLRKGPFLARVNSVDISWLPATGEFETFSLVAGKSDRV